MGADSARRCRGSIPDPATYRRHNLLPILDAECFTGCAPKTFWRYKANAQRAARDATTVPQIMDNTFSST